MATTAQPEILDGYTGEVFVDASFWIALMMGSDMPSGFGMPHVAGNNFSISVSPKSREESDTLFANLSEGGAVTMPMAEMFWGSYFGSCTDKFGINWQVNCEQSSA